MSGIEFEWDQRKERLNLEKHGVSFKEAQSVFSDEKAILIPDPDAADDEDRFVLLGLSALLRTLVVCHCYRSADAVVRIISARKANRKERQQYGRGRQR